MKSQLPIYFEIRNLIDALLLCSDEWNFDIKNAITLWTVCNRFAIGSIKMMKWTLLKFRFGPSIFNLAKHRPEMCLSANQALLWVWANESVIACLLYCTLHIHRIKPFEVETLIFEQHHGRFIIWSKFLVLYWVFVCCILRLKILSWQLCKYLANS